MSKLLLFVVMAGFMVSCVTSGTHQLTLDELAAQKKANEALTTENDGLKKQVADLTAEVAKLKDDIAKLKKELDDMSKNFMDAMAFNDDLKKTLKEKGASIDQLDAKNKELAAKKADEEKRAAEEQAKFLAEQQRLMAEQQQLKAELEQLKRMKEAAEKRNAEFANVMAKLKKMIDAGTLSVKVRKGRMIVTLSSDILFAVGATELTPEGKAAITELAATLKEIPDRNFLVVGHSDSTPIKKKFASNWELSSQRAIEVVKLMIASGVPPTMLSASGSAEFDPIADNDTPENKTLNRRVEIVFMPKIDELPGFGPEAK